MSAEITFGPILFGCLMGAVALGIYLRRVLPAHYLSADTKDAVKLAMGLVATMSALVLGLLVTSVKGAYDTRKGEVIQMAAKVAFIDRVLKAYGPEADELRRQFREVVEEDTRRLWPRVDDIPAQFRPTETVAIPSLSPTSSSGLFLATTPSAASRRRRRVSSWNLDSSAQC